MSSISLEHSCCTRQIVARLDTKPKQMTLVTLVALSAIAMIVIGALGLMAAQNPESWIRFPQIGFTTSLSIMTAGSVALFIVIGMAYLFKKVKAEQEVKKARSKTHQLMQQLENAKQQQRDASKVLGGISLQEQLAKQTFNQVAETEKRALANVERSKENEEIARLKVEVKLAKAAFQRAVLEESQLREAALTARLEQQCMHTHLEKEKGPELSLEQASKKKLKQVEESKEVVQMLAEREEATDLEVDGPEKAPTFQRIYVEQNVNLSDEERVELLQHKLETHEINFRSDLAYEMFKNHPPSEKLPYAHFTVPIIVDNLVFEVELHTLAVTQVAGNWRQIYRFRYKGKTFEAFGDSYFFLEDILGIYCFAPGAFQVAYRQWCENFEEWNKNRNGGDRFLDFGMLVTFHWMKMENGFLELGPSESEMSFPAGKEILEDQYYLPDYVGYEMSEDKREIRLTRGEPTPLINAECLDFLPQRLYKKVHAQNCLIRLKADWDLVSITYNQDSKSLLVHQEKNKTKNVILV